MSVLRVENGRVSWDDDQELVEAQKSNERVKEVMNKLGDIVFEASMAVGLSAVVSFLAVLLSAMNDPVTEVANTSAMLQALVRMNLADPDVPHLVYRCEVAE
jgi:hypothetical protein